MAALTAGSGPSAAQQADQFAENFVQEYVKDMDAEMESSWYQLNMEVSYESCTEKECEKYIELNDDKTADYTYYYKIEYTSDNIDDEYESLTGINDLYFFTTSMERLKWAKSDVYSRHHVRPYYDNVQNDVTTRIYVVDQQSARTLKIYDADHGHCYELVPYDDGDQLYVDGNLVYNYDYLVGIKEQEKESNTGKSSISSQNKKYSSGSGNSSRHKNTYSDPYDAKDYDNADDFADEWAEEFGDGNYDDGYDDAYDYWKDAND